MSGNGERIVFPLKLCFKGRAWYVYAYCQNKNDNRFFKLSRIRELRKINETFNIKAKEKVLNYLKQYNDTFVEITLQIVSGQAYRAYDEFKDITVLENGDFLVNGKYPQCDWLRQYIASF